VHAAMGLFGFKARAPSQARGELGGMDDQDLDDLDVPSTSSLAQRNTFRGGVPQERVHAGSFGRPTNAISAPARVARKRRFDLDDDDLELSQPPAGAAQLKASRVGVDRLWADGGAPPGQPHARSQALPSQPAPHPFSVQDPFPSFEEEFEHAAHGRLGEQPPATASGGVGMLSSQYGRSPPQHLRASQDDTSPRHHRPTDPGAQAQHLSQAVRPFRTRAPIREPLSLFSPPSYDEPLATSSQHSLRDMPPPSQRAHPRPDEPAPSQGLRRIPGPAGGQEEAARSAIQDPTQGGAAARGPELPLRKRFQAAVQGDRDFQSPAWLRLLSDLDLPSFEPASADPSNEAARCAPATHSTIASVVRGVALKKMDRMLVMIKSITVSDHCAHAVVKDPSGEMRACIHANVLEEEGDALTRGSALILTRVSIFNSSNGQSHNAIITPNNVLRTYPPGRGRGGVAP